MLIIGLEKTVDNNLFEILRRNAFKYKDRRFIFNLYKNQVAAVILKVQEKEATIRKGVREGCCH